VATLLLVDDDLAILDMLRDFLSETYECHAADCAEQALQYLDFVKYDVVITDLSMPGLAGDEVLRYVKRRDPTIPVIVISGKIIPEEERLIQDGVFAFLSKPFRLEQIEDVVTRALTHRQQLIDEQNWQVGPRS
jgi:DNA-binding NtrC family response regulator